VFRFSPGYREPSSKGVVHDASVVDNDVPDFNELHCVFEVVGVLEQVEL